jgi:aspartyl-tRNA(Asn)/glutamyl-tRNA(Gln) amidotransferase subunit C
MDTLDIDHLAKLARLQLSDKEKAEYEKSFPSILEYVSKLQEVDTSHVDAKPYLTDLQNQWRKDEIVDQVEERKVAHDNFPKANAGALEVPAVFE